MPIVMISGMFDPIRGADLRMLREAQLHGNVVVALNSDDFVARKKGLGLMPWWERAQILEAMGFVVVAADDADDTVAEAITRIKPDIYATAAPQTAPLAPEHAACLAYNIKEIFSVGGTVQTAPAPAPAPVPVPAPAPVTDPAPVIVTPIATLTSTVI